ncbi:cupin domain-containing protein [Pseudomonas sp. 3A(2025)]
MIPPILLVDAAGMTLSAPVPVLEPIGTPVAATALHAHETADKLLTGVWECSPGRWRRKVLAREFSHFIAGHCIFTPDDGEPVELRAGDAVLFPANCHGTWEVLETVRKSFVIIP